LNKITYSLESSSSDVQKSIQCQTKTRSLDEERKDRGYWTRGPVRTDANCPTESAALTGPIQAVDSQYLRMEVFESLAGRSHWQTVLHEPSIRSRLGSIVF